MAEKDIAGLNDVLNVKLPPDMVELRQLRLDYLHYLVSERNDLLATNTTLDTMIDRWQKNESRFKWKCYVVSIVTSRGACLSPEHYDHSEIVAAKEALEAMFERGEAVHPITEKEWQKYLEAKKAYETAKDKAESNAVGESGELLRTVISEIVTRYHYAIVGHEASFNVKIADVETCIRKNKQSVKRINEEIVEVVRFGQAMFVPTNEYYDCFASVRGDFNATA